MNKAFIICFFILVSSCNKTSYQKENDLKEKESIQQFIDNWHKSAAKGNFNAYFEAMDSVSVFIGTDATENWTKKVFKNFSKPYFERGSAWDFKAVDRNIYLSKQENFAWFDELLDTWMGACRGSGVLEKKDNQWKIKHYVLSVTVPNDDIKKLLEIKFAKDSIYLDSLKKNMIQVKK